MTEKKPTPAKKKSAPKKTAPKKPVAAKTEPAAATAKKTAPKGTCESRICPCGMVIDSVQQLCGNCLSDPLNKDTLTGAAINRAQRLVEESADIAFDIATQILNTGKKRS